MRLPVVMAAAEGENVPPDLVTALDKIIKGLQLLGDGLTMALVYILSAIGVQVPELAIRIGTIILMILLVWRLGNVVSKVVLYAMIFLLISLFAGLIPALGQYLRF